MKDTVYKYLPIERLSYLTDEYFRFTPPADLNDPFECYPILPTQNEIIEVVKIISKENIASIDFSKFSKKESENIKINYSRKVDKEINAILNNEPNNFQEQFYNRSIIGINYSFGILSLSRRWDSSLMWAHYTNSHKGFCIGFDREALFLKNKGNPLDPTFIMQSVKYSSKRIKVPVERGQKITLEILFTKSKDWEYEQEERIIALLTLADKVIKVQPFDIHLFKVPHNSIKEIIVGAKIDLKNFEIISDFCKKNNITLFKSKISDTEFDMIREKI